MGMLRSINRQTTICVFVMAIAIAATVECTQALLMTDMPEELQTKSAEARDRTLCLKLPLRQPDFHWRFLSRQDFLAGKLVLHILRDGESTPITIFDSGKLSAGWQPMTSQNKKAGDVYFGFLSTKKYSTAPGDRVKIELVTANDLDGIGAMQTGILPAGTYTAEGTYSGLIDKYVVPTSLQNLPEETVGKLRQNYEFRAFLENWEEQWDLHITGEDGWLPPAKRKAAMQFKALADEDSKEQ